MRVVILLALLGLVAAVSYPLVNRLIRIEREHAAIDSLRLLGEAQARFRKTNGGYAATLQSLVEPCRDDAQGAVGISGAIGTLGTRGYEIALRPAEGAVDGPLDCRGRVSSTGFYVSARPVVVGRDGFRGMAMTSAGRIFVFLDGVPPKESDMGPSGLAMPLVIPAGLKAGRYVP